MLTGSGGRAGWPWRAAVWTGRTCGQRPEQQHAVSFQARGTGAVPESIAGTGARLRGPPTQQPPRTVGRSCGLAGSCVHRRDHRPRRDGSDGDAQAQRLGDAVHAHPFCRE